MSTHQQSKPRRANQSMTEESDRPSTCKSKVGCDAMDDPCTNRMVPAALPGSTADFSNMNSFTFPSLLVQCSWPRIATGLVTSFMVVLPEKLRREPNMCVWETRPRCRLHKSPCGTIEDDWNVAAIHRLPCALLRAALRVAAIGLQRETA